MRYSFNLNHVDYTRVVSSAIREEVGKCLRNARQKKWADIGEISEGCPLLAYSIEKNECRHSWQTVKNMAEKYGFSVQVYLSFNVGVRLMPLMLPKPVEA